MCEVLVGVRYSIGYDLLVVVIYTVGRTRRTVGSSGQYGNSNLVCSTQTDGRKPICSIDD